MEEYTPSCLTLEKLAQKARSLPRLPGVYQMYDKKGTVIYVGKSRALHNRVLTYFTDLMSHTPKTAELVRNIADFQTFVTPSETEALLLENEKIKLYKPKYNIRLKDDKDYPYIRLSFGEEYPRLTFQHRRDKKDKRSRYFGPYSSAGAVREILATANKIFALPTCRRSFPRDIGKERPCIYYDLGRCCGVCTGKISPEEYRARLDEVVLFLKNDYRAVTGNLEKEMLEAADHLQFERAAKLRDRIKALKNLADARQVVKDLSFDADVFGVFQDECGGGIERMKVREGRLIDSVHFFLSPTEIVSPETFLSMLAQIYHAEEFLPREVLLPREVFDEENRDLFERLFPGVTLRVPERGDGRRLMELACSNAREAVCHHRKIQEKDEEVLVKLSSILGLEVVPEKIESIDISNSGADVIYASVIALTKARFDKKRYKTFSISSDKPDDPGSVYQAVSRRLDRYLKGDAAFAPLPDLFLVDGGKTQVRAAKRAFQERDLAVPVFGMVKDDFHKTRCLTDGEKEISIALDASVFRFIYGIQEEVHRFAFSRMDQKRRKSVKTSVLTKIPGIGEKKATALLRHFESIRAIRGASEEDLALCPGLSRSEAKAVRSYFESEKKE